MRSSRALLAWIAAGILGALLLAWAYPRAFPFAPRDWEISREEAVRIALERLRDLGDPVADPYVVTLLEGDPLLERRLQLALGERGMADLRATGLTEHVVRWHVFVYAPGALRHEWTYQAEVAPSGEVLQLSLRLDPQARGNPITEADARARAESFLAEQGIDLTRYEEPELRSQQLAARTDLTVRYRDRRANPTPGASHGLQVRFAGDRLAGFSVWVDDPNERALQESLRQVTFGSIMPLVLTYLLLPFLAVPFLKRYHEGEIGVRRGVQIFLAVLGLGFVCFLLLARAISQTSGGFGLATRAQSTWLMVVVLLIFYVTPAALLGFFAWSVGESVCRERWGAKLAAFDALFQREWGNATVARSSLRGVAAGLALAGAVAGSTVLLGRLGAWPLSAMTYSSSAGWPAWESLLGQLVFGVPVLFVVTLCALPLAVRRLGRVAGVAAAVALGAVLFLSPSMPVPFSLGMLVSLLVSGAIVGLFLRYDLLTVLVAVLLSNVLLVSFPLLRAEDPSLALQAWLALAVVASPLVASVRFLASGREFVYRYEDVPPHVRRIAERERQRVELETARRIQSSILPELPPQLNGVQISHAYLPASEVGGDFYDVLALEDGRLALAVGDVAGHGVSSGLVMSMAKSALAVQVTFNPEVEAVFNTLNRMIFQTARKRLLATLCYALLDPKERELHYASAGHLFPYVVSRRGGVHALESVAYPLGVRGQLQVTPRRARLEPGDILFLFSDGLVEARRDDGSEEFGFERLEQSLARHADDGVERLRDGVLADVARFTGNAPREDDQTILVLRLPAA